MSSVEDGDNAEDVPMGNPDEITKNPITLKGKKQTFKTKFKDILLLVRVLNYLLLNSAMLLFF